MSDSDSPNLPQLNALGFPSRIICEIVMEHGANLQKIIEIWGFISESVIDWWYNRITRNARKHFKLFLDTTKIIYLLFNLPGKLSRLNEMVDITPGDARSPSSIIYLFWLA